MKEDKLSRALSQKVLNSLEDAIGKENVSSGEMERLLYSHDLAPLPKEAGMGFKNIPDVVVRPKSVKDVAKIVRIAYKSGVAITPRGASTWGLGGCMPIAAGIVMDLSSGLNEVMEIDEVNMVVKVGAGCTWNKAIEEVGKKGYIIPSYPSSFPAATVGGWISTGGIGVGGYKYGPARHNIMNMEVVAADGTVMQTGYDKIANNMSGYDLNQLFSGAEGTLGIIATVTLRIHPMGIIKPIAFDFDQLKDMAEPINEIVRHPSVKPYHMTWADHYHFENQRKAGVHAPDVKNLFVVTLQGSEDFVALEEKAVEEIVSKYGGRRVDDKIAEAEWGERCYEFRARKVGAGSIPAEVVVSVDNWGAFVDECYLGFKNMKMDAGGVIGQIADRSTALFMPYYFMDTESLLGMTGFAYNFYMGDVALTYGGRSLGLGVFFAFNLDVIHDKGSVEFMRMLKTAIDPHDIANPGHLVCGKTRFGINMSTKLMGIGGAVIKAAKKTLSVDSQFADSKKRFYFDVMEEHKDESREVKY